MTRSVRASLVALLFVAVAPALAAAQPANPTAFPTPIIEFLVCDGIDDRAPAEAIGDALTRYASVAGYGQRCYPNRPPSPWNVTRGFLDLQHPGIPYHPLFNAFVWRCGCR